MSKQTEALKLALKRAFNLGQTYWQQADSEYTSQWKKADVTLASFNQLVEDTINVELAEQPAQQEPVAWVEGEEIYWNNAPDLNDWIRQNGQPLYTSPPIEATHLASQRSVKPWVGLTDVEWQEIDASLNGRRDLARIFVRAIEAKLQEKNA